MSVISEQDRGTIGITIRLRVVAWLVLSAGVARFEIVYGFLYSLEVGEVKVENVPVYIRHFFDDKSSIDGYLGLSMISKFVADCRLRRTHIHTRAAPPVRT